MKKLLAVFLLCSIALCAHAQWQSPSAEYHMRNYPTAADQAFEKFLSKIFKKADISSMKIGQHKFTLRADVEGEDNGLRVHHYFYRPQNGPVSFQEAVAIDEPTGKYRFISNPASFFVGPLRWKYVDYTISEIDVTVYQGDKLRLLQSRWSGQFGADCVFKYRKIGTWDVQSMDVLCAPLRAFYTGKETVVIKAFASSQDIGAYERACRVKAPGVLYRKFISGTDNFILKWDK